MSALLQAERAVLAGLMVADPATTYAVGNLPAEAFADPLHQRLFWHLLIGVEPAAVTDDTNCSSYLTELVAAGPFATAPEGAILDACTLIRRSWVERCRVDPVGLANWSPRGEA